MKLQLIRHLWGIEIELGDALPKIKEFGYHGIESGLPQDLSSFNQLRKDFDLAYIAMVFTGGGSVDAHVESFKQQVERAVEAGAFQVTAHSGYDGWTEAQSKQYFEAVLKFQETIPIPVAHETHRGRILFTPWVTDNLLKEFDSLRVCCDYSHWVCVCERLLREADDLFERIAAKAIHLHARVGFEEGPQVPDPRAPEYEPQLLAHEKWWDMIWKSQFERGFAFSTLTPEFGPPRYMHTLPYTKVPISNLWDICNWQAKHEKERFEQVYG